MPNSIHYITVTVSQTRVRGPISGPRGSNEEKNRLSMTIIYFLFLGLSNFYKHN